MKEANETAQRGEEGEAGRQARKQAQAFQTFHFRNEMACTSAIIVSKLFCEPAQNWLVAAWRLVAGRLAPRGPKLARVCQMRPPGFGQAGRRAVRASDAVATFFSGFMTFNMTASPQGAQ